MKINKFYFAALLTLPFVLTVFIGRFGFEDSDSGFLIGMGWRIINGEIPYKDFYYVRPPLSPYISAFFLKITPQFGQIFGLRVINAYQLLGQVILTLLVLNRFYNFNNLGINFNVFGIVSFFITSVGTLYFQWHTTDGIFFAILGFYFIVYFHDRNFVFLIISGVILTASFFCKQNFLIIPFLGVFFTLVQYGLRKSIFVIVGVLMAFLSFYLYLHIHGTLSLFLTQTSDVSSVKDLFYSGFLVYFTGAKTFLFVILNIFLAGILAFFVYQKRRFSEIIFKTFIISFVLVNMFGLFFMDERILIRFDRIVPLILISLFFYFLILGLDTIKKHYLLLCLLVISWTSSISWGATTPLMYFTPILFFGYYLLQSHFKMFNQKTIIIFSFSFIVYSIFVNALPYRDDFVWTISNDGRKLSRKLAFIKTNDVLFEKHLELKTILHEYSYKTSTILPSMPGAYYIYGLKNCLSIDWAMDVESSYDLNGIIYDLGECCEIIFMEKAHFGQPIGLSGKHYSSISDHVKKNYTLIEDKFIYFNIYHKNNK